MNNNQIPLKSILLIAVFSLIVRLNFAQERNLFQASPEKKVKRAERFEAGAPVFSPFLTPLYNPEFGFLVTGGALVTFKTKRNNEYLSHSTLPVTLGVSTSGAFTGSAYLTTYWRDDLIRFYFDVGFQDMPDNYWGVGIDAGNNRDKSETTTGYDKKWWKINPQVLFRISSDFYWGVLLDLNQTVAENVNDAMLEDPYYLKYGPDNYNSGIGLKMEYDSRDLPFNAWKGLYINASATFYGIILGGGNKYQVIEVNYSQYQQLIRQGSTLAWKIRTKAGLGDVPYGDMAMLGSSGNLRGYYYGQYRHNSMILALLEYKHMFTQTGSMDLSKHGMVLWIGGGSVFKNFDDIKQFLPNLGIGYRYEVQPRMNLRIDLGFGLETVGLYFNFNEAF